MEGEGLARGLRRLDLRGVAPSGKGSLFLMAVQPFDSDTRVGSKGVGGGGELWLRAAVLDSQRSEPPLMSYESIIPSRRMQTDLLLCC